VVEIAGHAKEMRKWRDGEMERWRRVPERRKENVQLQMLGIFSNGLRSSSCLDFGFSRRARVADKILDRSTAFKIRGEN